jgi:AraC-like DNA-binding protein
LIDKLNYKSIFEKLWDVEEEIDKYYNSVLIYVEIVNDLSNDAGIVDFLQEKAAEYDDVNFKALFTGGIAHYYMKNQKFFYAIQYYKEALKFNMVPSLKTNLLLQISNCFFFVKRYQGAIHFLNEASVINSKHGYDDHSDIYIKAMLAQNYNQLKNDSMVIECLLPALDNLNDFIETDRLAIVNNLSLAYLRTDSLNKAEILIEEADKLIEKIENNSSVLEFLNTKAEFLMKKSMNKNLERTIVEIIRLSENESDNSVLYDTYSFLAKYYEVNSNYKDANKYLKKLIIVNDSIKSIENQNVMNEFLVKYETEKKEKQILLQENEIQEKRAIQLLLIAGITTLAVFMGSISFVLTRRNKYYKKMALNILDERNIAKSEKNQNMKVENKLNDKLLKQIRLKLDELLMAKVYLDRNMTLNKLAEMCDTNQSYLSQVINKYYGQNFSQLINNFRVREALELLSQKDNNFQLKSLYLDLGFNSYSVFNEAFKKIVGVTPGYYQKTVVEKFKNEIADTNQK